MFIEIFGTLKWLKYMARAGIFTTGVFYMSTMVYLIVQCAPQTGLDQLDYLAAIAAPQCSVGNRPVNTAGGIMNICSDAFILGLPVPAIWSLQLPTRKKLGLVAILLIGLM